MVRALLMLWYTLTVLMGPGLCCCSARSLTAAQPDAHHVGDADTPAKKTCCCPDEGIAGCPPDRSSHPQDGHPDGCPCKKLASQDQDRPGPPVYGGAEPLGQPRFLDLPPAEPFALGLFAIPTAGHRGGGAHPGGWAGVAGRDLLAAYHILRC